MAHRFDGLRLCELTEGTDKIVYLAQGIIHLGCDVPRLLQVVHKKKGHKETCPHQLVVGVLDHLVKVFWDTFFLKKPVRNILGRATLKNALVLRLARRKRQPEGLPGIFGKLPACLQLRLSVYATLLRGPLLV